MAITDFYTSTQSVKVVSKPSDSDLQQLKVNILIYFTNPASSEQYFQDQLISNFNCFCFFISPMQKYYTCNIEFQTIKILDGFLRLSFFHENDPVQQYPFAVIELNSKTAKIRTKYCGNSCGVISLYGKCQDRNIEINFEFTQRDSQRADYKILRSFLRDLKEYRKTANRELELEYVNLKGFQMMDESFGEWQNKYLKYEEDIAHEEEMARKEQMEMDRLEKMTREVLANKVGKPSRRRSITKVLRRILSF